MQRWYLSLCLNGQVRRQPRIYTKPHVVPSGREHILSEEKSVTGLPAVHAHAMLHSTVSPECGAIVLSTGTLQGPDHAFQPA